MQSVSVRTILLDAELSARDLIRDSLSNRSNFQIIGETGAGAEANRLIETLHPDLIISEIHLADTTGFQVLKQIKGHQMPSVIFVTAYGEFALDAFNVHAADYLLKPLDQKRFSEALDRVLRQISSNEKLRIIDRISSVVSQYWAGSDSTTHVLDKRIPIRDDKGRTRFIDIHNIDWIEAAGDYVCVHVGTENYVVRQPLNDFQSSLPSDFLRIHRSYIVNTDRIVHMQEIKDRKFIVDLSTSKTLPVGRTHYKTLKACLKKGF